VSPPPSGGVLKICEFSHKNSIVRVPCPPGRGTREPADFFERKSPSDGLIPPGASPEGMRNSRPLRFAKGGTSRPSPYARMNSCVRVRLFPSSPARGRGNSAATINLIFMRQDRRCTDLRLGRGRGEQPIVFLCDPENIVNSQPSLTPE
jgi:hypothetical protein